LTSPDPALADLLTDALRRGRPISFVAGGYSMVPTLWPKDELTILPFPRDGGPVPGQIVLAVAGARWCVHRCVGTSADRRLVTLCGDGLGRPHDVPAQAVVGRLAAIRRLGLRLELDSGTGRAYGAVTRALRPLGPALAPLARRVVLTASAARRPRRDLRPEARVRPG
jgi:hypothetical protein